MTFKRGQLGTTQLMAFIRKPIAVNPESRTPAWEGLTQDAELTNVTASVKALQKKPSLSKAGGMAGRRPFHR